MPSPSTSAEKRKEEDSNSNKNKLSHQGFRLEEQVIKTLAEEAVKKGISVSSLVNKILKNYVTHEMQFEELGFILVSKDFLRKIFSVIDDEKTYKTLARNLEQQWPKSMCHIFTLKLIATLWFSFWIIGLEGFNHVIIWSKIATEAKNTILQSIMT